MIFIQVVEVILFLTVLLFFVTQLFLPVVTGMPVLPMFRRSNARLESELERTEEEIAAEEMKRRIRQRKEVVDQFKKENL